MTDDTRILSAEEWTRLFGVLCRDDGLDDIYNAEEKLQLHDLALRVALAAAEEQAADLDRAWQVEHQGRVAAEERAEQAEHDHGNLNADRIRAEAERDQAIRERDFDRARVQPLVVEAVANLRRAMEAEAQVRTLRELLSRWQQGLVPVGDYTLRADAYAALGEKNDGA